MYFQMLRTGTILALALVAAGCSTHRNDGTTVSKTVEINVGTRPEGGRCTLERDGKEIAVVQSAPQSVTIDRGIPNINVTCDMEGHITSFETVKSRYVGGPVHNYGGGGLIGSLVVLAIVAGTPANYEYPSYVTVTMEPNVFYDAASRDARYEDLRKQAAARHDGRVVTARQQCAQNAELCRTAQADSEKQRDSELARLEEFKAKAEIRPPNAPAAAPRRNPG